MIGHLFLLVWDDDFFGCVNGGLVSSLLFWSFFFSFLNHYSVIKVMCVCQLIRKKMNVLKLCDNY
jgi:hypothetical protein